MPLNLAIAMNLTSGGSAPVVPVVIANRANTTVTPTSDAYSIQKTGGVGGNYDASAVSSQGLSGDFTLRLKRIADGAGGGYGGGMNSDPLTDDSYASIDRLFLYAAGTGWAVYENGSQIVASLADATYAWVWRRGTTVGYGRGATLATAMASPDRTVTDSATLYFDSSFNPASATLEAQLIAQ